jgi:hypothetical protein
MDELYLDYCELCERAVRDGERHDWQAHGANKEAAAARDAYGVAND